jgi:hypothetical protein
MNDQTGNGKFKYTYTIPTIYKDKNTGKPYIKLGKKKKWLNTNMNDTQLKKYVEKNFKIKKKIKANVSFKKPKQKKKPQKKGIEQKVSQKVVVISPSDKKDTTPIYQNVSRLDPDVQNLVNKIRTGEVYVSKSDSSKPEPKPKKEPEPKVIKSSIISTPSILSIPPSPSAPPIQSLPSTPIIPQYEPYVPENEPKVINAYIEPEDPLIVDIEPEIVKSELDEKHQETKEEEKKEEIEEKKFQSRKEMIDELLKLYTKKQLVELLYDMTKTNKSKLKKMRKDQLAIEILNIEYGVEGNGYNKKNYSTNELINGQGKEMGGGLWTSQIIEIMSKVKPFIGCIASDQFDTLLPRIKPNTKLGFITNLSPSTSGGSHWVAIAINATNNKPDSNSIMYYDPFGKDVPFEMLQGLKQISNKIAPDKMLKFKVNSIQHQDIKTDNCGYFSIKFLLDILTRGKSFAQATGYDEKIKDQSKQREKEIENLKGKAPFNYINMYQGQDGKGIKETVKKVASKVVNKVKDVAKNIYDRIKSIFTGVSGSASLRKFLEKYGNEKITAIKVGRQPISGYIRKILNLLSLGKLEKGLKELKYDDLFHLYMYIKLSNGKTFHLEKNQRIAIYEEGVKGETIDVPLKSPITVIDFIEKAKKRMGDKFYPYSAIENNCQNFIANVLSANGLLNDSSRKFIHQDVESLFKKIPDYVKIIANKVTDVAGRAETVLEGNGKKKQYN